MKLNATLILALSLLIAWEQQSIENFAYERSENVKEQIIDESHFNSDKIEIDLTRQNWQTIFYWKDGNKFREYNYRQMEGDAVISIFYSTNQEFELVREFCPGVEGSFEGIKYKGKHLGLSEFHFCSGEIEESGFRFDGNVGVWKEYDENEKLIKTTDDGNLDRVNGLKEIKYR